MFAFLAPWFLGGLALLAVPVLVHLTRRDRAAPVPFPSLMFVRRLPQAVTRKRRLRDLPLLLLRALALALLVAAFARPLLDRARAAIAPGAGGRELVVLLDRSYSMGAPGRWARAQDAARRALATLGPDDRGSVILFDATASVAAPRTADGASLRAAVDSVHPGAGATRYAPALALASRMLAQSPLARREALLVTDFQRGAWTPAPEARLPGGARLTWTDVGGAPTADVAVAGVELRTDSGGSVERVRPVARLVTSGSVSAVPVSLEVEGRVVQTVTARVGAGGVASVAFAPVPVPSGWTRATVRAAADALPADDAYHMVLSRRQGLRVLLVDGPSRREDPGLFLRRAFDVGDAPRFQVDVTTPATLGAAALAGHALVVLHDAPLRGAAARAVVDFVRRGGGLLVAMGEASAPEAWDPALAALLPARPGEVVDAGGGAHLAAFERAHPIFAPFSAPHSGDLAAARVLRRRALAPAADAQVLARFDDGTPALVESAAPQAGARPTTEDGADGSPEQGRVLVWASTLDAYWTDLPLQPVFVPFAHGLATHAARFAPAPPARAVGEAIDPARVLDRADGEFVVDAPSGRHVRVVAPALVTMTEAGFYGVRPAGAPVDVAVPVAANVDPAEADPAHVDPATIAAAVAPGASAPNTAAAAPQETRTEREARQSIWWWLLATVALLLAVESIFSNRRRTVRRVAG
ncbi:MAG: BatA and WFA domain-containing protein [Gemmatirosa sp.]|nr:BatA and WFA domain-containing protein [Gemmatirosa sp.]